MTLSTLLMICLQVLPGNHASLGFTSFILCTCALAAACAVCGFMAFVSAIPMSMQHYEIWEYC